MTKKIRLDIVIGSWLVLIGALIAGAPIIAAPTLRTFAGSIGVTQASAFAFLVVGVWLLLPSGGGAGRALRQACGPALMFLSGGAILSLLSHGAGASVDSAFMAANTAAAFFLTGMLCIAIPLARGLLAGLLLPLVTFVIIAIGLVSLVGYALRLELLYDWFLYAEMSPLSAVNFLFVGIALGGRWYRAGWFQALWHGKEDQRITVVGSLLLMFVALLSWLAGFAAMQGRTESTLRGSLESALAGRVHLFETSVERAYTRTIPLSQDALLANSLSRLNANGDAGALETLKATAQSLMTTGFSAVAILDENGRLVASAGGFASQSPLTVRLANLAGDASLLWQSGLLLRMAVPVFDQGRQVGTIRTELPLPSLTASFAESAGFGKTEDFAVCVPSGEAMSCFPTSLGKKPIIDLARTYKGIRLPMSYALDGQTGSVVAWDYRRKQVVAAYSPVGQMGLGMVLKLDTAELYQPIRSTLQKGLPLVLFLIIGSLVLLRWQLFPLVRKLVQAEEAERAANMDLRASEAKARAVLENTADGIVVLDRDGCIQTFNPAAERLFGYQVGEVLGRNVGMLISESNIGREDNDPPRYLSSDIAKIVGISGEALGRRKNGTAFPLELAVSETMVAGRQMFICLVRDITDRHEEQNRQQRQQAALRALNEIAALPNPGIREQLTQALTVGARYLDQERGIVSHVEDDAYKIVAHVGPGHGLKDGQIFPLKDTYCSLALEAGDVVAISRVSATEHAGRSCAQAFSLDSYIGVPVRVDGKPFGTLSFFAPVARGRPFDQADMEFVRLLARWVGALLARDHSLRLLFDTLALQKAILDSADYTIISTAVDGTILTFNAAAERLLGYTKEEVVGKTTPAIVHLPAEVAARAETLSRELGRPVAPGFEAFVAKAALGGADENEWTYVRKDGSHFSVLLSVTALRGAAGEVTGYLGIGQDISQRKRDQGLLDVIRRAQSQYIRETDPHALYEGLLADIVHLTDSQFGFIGEVYRGGDGRPALRMLAISDVAWDASSRALFDAHRENGMVFTNMDTLFGTAILSGQPVIANEAGRDPRSGGTPPGHPPIKAFLGAPVFQGEELIAVVALANRPGGYSETLLAFLQPFLSTVANITGAVRNEERRRQAEADLNRFKNVLDNTLDMLFMFEPEHLCFVYVNAGAVASMAYSREELLSMTPYQIQPTLTEQEFRQRISPLLMGMKQSTSYESVFHRKDGTDFPVEVFLQYVQPTGADGLFVAIVRDITERRKVDRLKNEFVSTVSHELRTPLTSIRGALGLVAGGAAGHVAEQAKGLIDIAYKNSERLVRLINDILDVEKIESGKMRFDIGLHELEPLVRQALVENRSYGEQYGVAFSLAWNASRVRVRVDPDRFIQVMSNLLSNAAKFSSRGSTVQVDVHRNTDIVWLEVRDQGPGIPAEFHDKIFQKFSQADASDSRREGGTGLGLAISKAIIESMGGRIGFRSPPGEGATFFIELPLWQEELTHLDGGGDIRPGQSRVLICDDDRDVAEVMGAMLSAAGYAVDVAHDAAQARHALENGRYALLLLDLVLPGQDGISLIRELRANPALRDTPIVVVSVKAIESKHEISGNGFAVMDWLDKPADHARLLAAVERATATGPSEKPRLLYVEDDPGLWQVVISITAQTADVDCAKTLKEARQKLRDRDYSLVLLDLALPDGAGAELLPEIAALTPSPPVVIFSAHTAEAEIADSVSAVLVKSSTSNQDLLATIRSVMARNRPHPASESISGREK